MAEMSNVTSLWTASPELQKMEALRDGRTCGKERELVVSLDELSREQRETVLAVAKIDRRITVDLRTHLVVAGYASGLGDAKQYLLTEKVEFDAALTPKTAVAQTAALQAINEKATADAQMRADAYLARQEKYRQEQAEREAKKTEEYERQLAIYRELEPTVSALIAGEDLGAMQAFTFPAGYDKNFPNGYGSRAHGIQSSLSNLLSKRIKEIERKRFEAEKARWIAAHGSDHLRRAFAAGHHSGRQYAIERAAREYPGWVLDYTDMAEWSVRTFPSVAALDALDEAQAINPDAEIVWLTVMPSSEIVEDEDELYSYDPSCACEAIIMRDAHLNRVLVRVV